MGGSFLNNYFGEKICINLARRSDRWVRAQEEFRLHGLTSVQRFEAYDGTSMRLPDGWDYGAGSYGCLRSHTSVVQAARQKGCPSILILEDDVEFHPQLDRLFRQYAEQIPQDWDALLFGGMHRTPPEHVSQNIVRLKETSSTFAYAIRNTLYDAFLEINRDTMIAVDENNHILQRSYAFYCCMPHLAWVRRDHSDVMESEVNPWWLRYSVGLFGPEQERTLRDIGVILFFDSDRFSGRTAAEPSVKVLQSVLRLYTEVVEESAICVIERGDQPLLTRLDLREACVYRFFAPATTKAQCVRSAADALPGRQFFVCASHDIYPFRSELRATLLYGTQYDLVSPLEEPLRLDENDVEKVMRDEVGAVDTGRYPARPADPLNADFCIIAARLLPGLEWPERSEILTPALLERSRVFRSPSRLVRLSSTALSLGAIGD